MSNLKRSLVDLKRDHRCWAHRSDLLRLDGNEFPAGLNMPNLNIELQVTLENQAICLYPDVDQLMKQWSDHEGISLDQMILFPGSDPAIKAVFEAYVSKDNRVVALEHTYGMYAIYAQWFGARYCEVPYLSHRVIDFHHLLGVLKPPTKLLLIANPNNTGWVMTEVQLLACVRKAQDQGIMVLIDEAYHGYYPNTMVKHIDQFDNMLVSRSFSKSFGAPGIRVGALFASSSLISEISKLRLTHEVSSLSAMIACSLIQNNFSQKITNMISNVKSIVIKGLKSLKFDCVGDYGNFIYIKHRAIASDQIHDGLFKQGISTRLFSGGGILADFIRVTIGSMDQMDALIASLTMIVGNDEKTTA